MFPSILVKSDFCHSTTYKTIQPDQWHATTPDPWTQNIQNPNNSITGPSSTYKLKWTFQYKLFHNIFCFFPCAVIFVIVSLRPTWSQHQQITSIHLNQSTKFSYKILNPKAAEAEKDPAKVAKVILESIGLDTESYRLGNTKAWVPTDYSSFHTISICDACAPKVFLSSFSVELFFVVFLCYTLLNRGQMFIIKTHLLVLPPDFYTTPHVAILLTHIRAPTDSLNSYAAGYSWIPIN